MLMATDCKNDGMTYVKIVDWESMKGRAISLKTPA